MNRARALAPELFATNEVLLFDRPDAAEVEWLVPGISAISFVASATEPSERASDLLAGCSQEAEEFISGSEDLRTRRLWLYAAHGPWQPKSAVVKYKKLWRSLFGQGFSFDFGVKSEELQFESADGFRFAGVVEVPLERFPDAAEQARQNRAFALILSERSDISTVEVLREVSLAAFHLEGSGATSVDWVSLSRYLCPRGDVAIRAYGYFDDVTASLDFIMPTELFLRLGLTGMALDHSRSSPSGGE